MKKWKDKIFDDTVNKLMSMNRKRIFKMENGCGIAGYNFPTPLMRCM